MELTKKQKLDFISYALKHIVPGKDLNDLLKDWNPWSCELTLSDHIPEINEASPTGGWGDPFHIESRLNSLREARRYILNKRRFPTIEPIQSVKDIYGIEMYLCNNLGDTRHKLQAYESGFEPDEDVESVTYSHSGKSVIVMYIDPECAGPNVISHECFHAVCRIAGMIEQEVDTSEHEWAAYLMGHLVERAHQFFLNHKQKDQ